MSKLLAVSGSPRRHGNTETALDIVIEMARVRGVDAKKLILNDLKIRPCQDCGGCAETGACVINDDMALVHSEMDSADLIVIGSPIYFAGVSGQLKVMVDRMQSRWVRRYVLGQKTASRRKGMVILCGHKTVQAFYDCSAMVVDVMFKTIGVADCEKIFIPGVEERGESGIPGKIVTEDIKKIERFLSEGAGVDEV